jgi:hypothetical protein
MKMLAPFLVAIGALVPAWSQAQADGALGLSRHQLEDADLINAQGREIGEVERVVIAADGQVSGLIVEIDQRDPKPDRHVQIPLTGLKAVPEPRDPGDFNIQTDKSANELLALPAAPTR